MPASAGEHLPLSSLAGVRVRCPVTAARSGTANERAGFAPFVSRRGSAGGATRSAFVRGAARRKRTLDRKAGFRGISPGKSRPSHLAVTHHSVLLPQTFYRRAPRTGGRPPVRDLGCSRSNELPRSFYKRVSGNSLRCPGRNNISAVDVTNRLGTTRWISTPSQFVNPEMTECSPAASARKPSCATRSADSRPTKRPSGTPAALGNSEAVGPGHNAQTRTPWPSTSRASASANSYKGRRLPYLRQRTARPHAAVRHPKPTTTVQAAPAPETAIKIFARRNSLLPCLLLPASGFFVTVS